MNQKMIQVGLGAAIILALGGTAVMVVKMTKQDQPNANTSVLNTVSEQTSILKSVHKNVKVTDPNTILLTDAVAAKEKLKTFPSVIVLKTDEELKTAAIAYNGNDTDDARHIIQIFRLQLLQLALLGYRGIHETYPDSLSPVVAEWSAIVDYCVAHQSVCNGAALRKDELPVITDIYTDTSYVYSSTSDNFSVRYFMTGCDSVAYCEGDEKVFVNGENTMTKDGISTYVTSLKK